MVAAFPAHQPDGGVHGEPVPHLTVGERRLGDTVERRAAEASVQQHLPIRAWIPQAVLLAGRRERASWRLVTPLG